MISSFYGVKEVQTSIEWKHKLYKLLNNGELDKAEELILNVMEVNFEDKEVDSFLKVIKFWKNRAELFDYSENGGENLLSEWKKFEVFCSENGIENKKLLTSIKSFIYSKAVDFLLDSYRVSPVKDREKLLKLGEAFYEIGLIDKSLETYEYLFSIDTEKDPRVYMWLANLYFEVGEKELSMMMYNDLFFYFSPLVEIKEIMDPAICRIYEMVKSDFSTKEEEIIEWLPVYCYLYDVLTVKRKLEYVDFVDLRKKILDFEKALSNNAKLRNVIVPRLVNCYIWLIDYYLYQASTVEPVKGALKRINELIDYVEFESTRNRLKERVDFVFKNLIEKKQALQKAGDQ